MAFAINTNVQSLNAQNNLNRVTKSLGTTFQRLSSGLRINHASDDAAGLSISDRMTAQVRGLNQSVRNANDAISLVQVAEGALEETTNALQRIRELSVQAANDTYTTGDREDMQKEVNQLLEEIQRISSFTEFNDQTLLGGSTDGVGGTAFTGKFHVGADKDQTISVGIGAANVSALGLVSLSTATAADMNAVVSNGGMFNLATQTAADSAITVLDNALDSVANIRADLGAFQNRFESVISNLSNISENTSAARSRIMDADIASETAALTQNAILQQAGTAILAQANQQPQIALQLLG